MGTLFAAAHLVSNFTEPNSLPVTGSATRLQVHKHLFRRQLLRCRSCFFDKGRNFARVRKENCVAAGGIPYTAHEMTAEKMIVFKQ